jgi:gamma-glutamyl phosphate reductase
MKNDRLSSHGLVHIHRDFEVDLYKAMEVFVSAKTRRADFGQFKEILVYQRTHSFINIVSIEG